MIVHLFPSPPRNKIFFFAIRRSKSRQLGWYVVKSQGKSFMTSEEFTDIKLFLLLYLFIYL